MAPAEIDVGAESKRVKKTKVVVEPVHDLRTPLQE